MAGHSKWANIQHRKRAQDAKRGKAFTKLIRDISTAARSGGGDAGANSKLRIAIDKALQANMPRDTIERAIKRGAGQLDGAEYELVRYEGYGPAGVAVMVDCLTDNRNRTVAEVRHVFSKAGGALGTDGCVAYLFSETGVILLPAGIAVDAAMEVAIEAGAEDLEVEDDGSLEITTGPRQFEAVRDALLGKGYQAEFAELIQRSSSSVVLDAEQSEKMARMLDDLEELDDVQSVSSNAEFAAENLS